MIEYLQNLGPFGPYLAIIMFLVLTGAGLPVPEEVPIVTAGVFASRGELQPWLALASCLVGALLGDSVFYAAGRFLGRSFFRRHKWFALLLDEKREEQMEKLIRRHGLKAFFVARFMIGVRAPMYLAAGVMRVSWTRFILIDGISATVVVGIVFGLSYFYGNQITWLVHEFSIAVTVVAVIAVLTGLVFYFMRRRSRPAADAALESLENGDSGDTNPARTAPEPRSPETNGQGPKPDPLTAASASGAAPKSRTLA